MRFYRTGNTTAYLPPTHSKLHICGSRCQMSLSDRTELKTASCITQGTTISSYGCGSNCIPSHSSLLQRALPQPKKKASSSSGESNSHPVSATKAESSYTATATTTDLWSCTSQCSCQQKLLLLKATSIETVGRLCHPVLWTDCTHDHSLCLLLTGKKIYIKLGGKEHQGQTPEFKTSLSADNPKK